MAEITTIARPYAKAAFAYALENDQLLSWSEMLSFLSIAVADEHLITYLDNPTRTVKEKTNTLAQIGADKIDGHCVNFLNQLIARGRLMALPAIHKEFERLRAEREKSIDVSITTAFPLSDSEIGLFEQTLSKKLGLTVNMETHLDKQLVGGLIINANDLVIDGSVRGKLAKLAENLNY